VIANLRSNAQGGILLEPMGLTLIPADYFLLVIGQPQQDYAESWQNKITPKLHIYDETR
jgi:hypothetical protein